MRPLGEISEAILAAAAHLVREVDGEQRGPTLQELAKQACVGVAAARITVANLKRTGKLRKLPQHRRVSYRNRPVAEYAPAPSGAEIVEDVIDLGAVMGTAWATR